MNQSGYHVVRLQAGLGEPVTIFRRAVGPAFGQGEEGGGVKGDGQRAVEGVVQEDVVDQESAAWIEAVGAAPNQLPALGDVPVVQDVGEENGVGPGQWIAEHIARMQGEADPTW